MYFDGFYRSFGDTQPLADIHDGDSIYAVETPHNPHSMLQSSQVKPYLHVHCNRPVEVITMVIINQQGLGRSGKRLVLCWYTLQCCQFQARRALMLFKNVLLRTRKALLVYKVYGNNTLLVLNEISLNSVNALLALSRRFYEVFKFMADPCSQVHLNWNFMHVSLTKGTYYS